MRRSLLVTLLAASALVPTAAMAQEEGGRFRGQRQNAEGAMQQDRAAFRAERMAQRGPDASMVRQERQQQRQEQRQERQAQFQPPVQAPAQVQAQVQAQVRQQAQPQFQPQFQQRREFRQDRQDFRQDRAQDRQDFRQDRRFDRGLVQNGVVPPPQAQLERRDDRRDFRNDRRDDRQDFRADRRDDRQDFRQDRQQDRRFDQNGNRGFNNGQQFNNGQGFNNNQGFRGQNFGGRNRGNDFRGREFNNRGNWNRNWRQNQQFNWQGYRGYNRNFFQLPRYYAPRGWNFGYQRFGIGFTLNSVLFGQNYWIDDPFYYHLPPAYGPYEWVRYYNDALLVDIRTGYVVDTVYDIFW